MKKLNVIHYLLIPALFWAGSLMGQFQAKGRIIDDKGASLPFATAALLNPNDSTLAFFGITDPEGNFDIRNIKGGSYLLQCSYLGFKTLYKPLNISQNTELNSLVLQPNNTDLGTVQIEAERIPISIKGDTIEYNAGAFKTKPDANVEELLKKLPGVDVDRAGNIKAQGEDVKKILVDGKEFFSNDPKIASKNIPADAIKKVQVFDKTSDQSDFTGIDDGNRDKTINLMLKDDKKDGLFGDIGGGYGSDNRYQASAKVYNFSPTRQMAALGMVNNINQFGFSLNDYINFRGGIGALMSGGGFQLNSSSALPINFGQPVNGLIRSGAGGVNFNYEPVKNRRLNLSYLGSQTKTTLIEDQYTQNFTETGNFERQRNSRNVNTDNGHGFSASYRGDLDSLQQITASANVNLSSGNGNNSAQTRALMEKIAFNQLDNSTLNKNSGINGSSNLNYTLKTGRAIPYIKAFADLGFDQNLNSDTWYNTTTFFNPEIAFQQNQFQKNRTKQNNFGGGLSASIRLGNGFYAETQLSAQQRSDDYSRIQGIPPGEQSTIDSLQVDFNREHISYSPSLGIKKNNNETQFTASLALEMGQVTGQLFQNKVSQLAYTALLPKMRFNHEYASGKRYGINIDSRINTPQSTQLQPVVNNANPLSLFSGNTDLKAEKIYNTMMHWLWFDQFSFTSIMANVNGSYTADKITLGRTINPDLSQSIQYVNVDNQIQAGANIELSTPIRKLGLNVELGLEENFTQSLAPVNGIINTTKNYTHGAELSFNKRKSEKLSLSFGSSLRFTEAYYSLQSQLNNKFFTLSYFTDANYSPNEHWNLSLTADVSSYQSKQFAQNIVVPLLQAEVSHHFWKANRASLSLKAFDLLNKNTGIQRVSELNYLQQTQSNIIGRYFMLSFKYKLSKIGAAQGGNLDIKIKNR